MSEPNEEEMSVGQKMEQRIGEAIAKAISEVGNGYTIKWVAAVEMMDSEGDRGLWTFTSPNSTRWDIAGIVKELEHRETAHTLFHLMDDMRDEGC